jgi:hypothetical protein
MKEFGRHLARTLCAFLPLGVLALALARHFDAGRRVKNPYLSRRDIFTPSEICPPLSQCLSIPIP